MATEPKGIIRNVLPISDSNRGELAALDQGSVTGTSKVLRYPEEVGDAGAPHWVLFNIFIPQGDTYNKDGEAAGQSRTAQNIDLLNQSGKFRKTVLGGTSAETVGDALATGGTAALMSGGGKIGSRGVFSGVMDATAKVPIYSAAAPIANRMVEFQPRTKKVDLSIAIYMPDTVMSSMNHGYSATSATAAAGVLGKASALRGQLGEALKDNQDIDGILAKIKEVASDVADTGVGRQGIGELLEGTGAVGEGFSEFALRSLGNAVNPQTEMLYSGSNHRSFIFEFKFQARSQKEALRIKEIIQTFKRYSAPSIEPNSDGRFFRVPGQFDITFKYGNPENEFISKISTCVLDRIDVDYAGSGQFISFSDGAPVDISVQLVFTEGMVITRELIDKFGY